MVVNACFITYGTPRPPLRITRLLYLSRACEFPIVPLMPGAAMAIYQDTFYSQTFKFVIVATGLPLNISGAAFTAAIRKNVADPDPALVTISTGSGGLTITDAANGLLQMTLTKVQTALLPLGWVYADFMRTDQAGTPVRYFGVTFKVLQPVTRL